MKGCDQQQAWSKRKGNKLLYIWQCYSNNGFEGKGKISKDGWNCAFLLTDKSMLQVKCVVAYFLQFQRCIKLNLMVA
jgi:hypothetical protein